MVYLKNPKSERRPFSSDVIVLSVRTTLEPNVIVAGAMIPVSRIPSSGFPFQFRINAKNAIQNKASSSSPQETWNYVMNNNDLLVQAVVCDRDTIRFENGGKKNRNIYEVLDICQLAPVEHDSMSTRLSGEGIAKLIRYTGSNTMDKLESSSSASESKFTTTPNEVIIRAPVSLPLR